MNWINESVWIIHNSGVTIDINEILTYWNIDQQAIHNIYYVCVYKVISDVSFYSDFIRLLQIASGPGGITFLMTINDLVQIFITQLNLKAR